MSDFDVNGNSGSFWMKTCPKTNFNPLKKELKVDTVILGGGIGGITTATLLKELGHSIAIIESDRIVKDVTVGTTAKISVAPNMIYNNIIKNLGQVKAQLYATANGKALEKIGDIIFDKGIECEFHRTPLYIYTESQNKVEKNKRRISSCKKTWTTCFLHP